MFISNRSICSGLSNGQSWVFLSGGKVGKSSLYTLNDLLHSKRVEKMLTEYHDDHQAGDGAKKEEIGENTGNVPMILKLKPFTGLSETTLKTSVVSKKQKTAKNLLLSSGRFSNLKSLFLKNRTKMLTKNYTQNECRFEIEKDLSNRLPVHFGAIRGLQCLGWQ